MYEPKCLAVLLFHNDEDIVEDQIKYYKHMNRHHLIVFNHNSNDNTSNIINKYLDDIICVYTLSDKIIFKTNQVHETIYKILLGDDRINKNEIKLSIDSGYHLIFSITYDWISFPESDEFLEGPTREYSYYQHLCILYRNVNINKITFSNIIFWFTENDDMSIVSPIDRIKHYCYKKNCGIRLYAWRGNETIVRPFGHITEKEQNDECITNWKTRHYEIRSKKHFSEKTKDRKDITIGSTNHHYKIMSDRLENNVNYGLIKPSELFFDDGINELKMTEIFDWNKIY